MKPNVLFEVSSEVCRKIGGIYTVIKSKSRSMIKEYGSGYYFFGMVDDVLNWNEFEEKEVPSDFVKIFDRLRERHGLVISFGVWKDAGSVKTFLINSWDFKNKKSNDVKGWLWDDYGVNSLNADEDYTINISWAYSVGLLIDELSKLKRFNKKRVVAHFHEWISGAGLLYLNSVNEKVRTVWTTHATVMGRTLNESGVNVFSRSKKASKTGIVLSDSVAVKHNNIFRHQIEKSCAKNADVFTTVSEVTGIETKYVLGVSPDVILPNALNFSSFGDYSRLLKNHTKNRDDVYDFIRSYFYPYYYFPVFHTPIIYLSGRYEVHDKGIDLFFESLGKLNKELKEANYVGFVVGFVFIPTDVRSPKISVFNNYEYFKSLKNRSLNVSEKVFENFIKIKDVIGLKKAEGYDEFIEFNSLQREPEGPPIICYDLNYENDKMIKLCLDNGLLNREEDKVKMIIYPTYLKDGDGLLNKSYFDLMTGLDIGLFPSRYEPWGYTPIEAGAFLNVALTTDHAGFGLYVKPFLKKNSGMKVIDFEGRTKTEFVNDVVKELSVLINLPRSELEKRKVDARRIAMKSEWKNQIKYYFEAHSLALKKRVK